MNVTSNKLVLFTEEFPCGGIEPFLINEFAVVRKRFNTKYIVPLRFGEITEVDVDDTIEVIDLKKYSFPFSGKKVFIRSFPLVLKITFLEVLRSQKKLVFLKHFREFNSYLLQCISRSYAIEKLVKQKNIEDAVFYSFWMSEYALSLAILKDKKVINRFVFRANGFDLYEDQTKYNYIPYRSFIYSKANKMFAVSKKSADFMRSFHINTNNITHSYFGTKDVGISVFNPDNVFTILTYSDLRRIKRTHLLVDILKNISFSVNWIHVGSTGDAETLFYEKIKELPKNIKIEIHERKNSYADLISFIKDNHYNIFILLSETEGLPVSLIEVTSMGIPVLATDVGGVSEIVNNDNGFIIPKDFDAKKVADLLNDFAGGEKNTLNFRKKVRKTWEDKFMMEKNYENFCNQILN